jgi:hypothetical protein
MKVRCSTGKARASEGAPHSSRPRGPPRYPCPLCRCPPLRRAPSACSSLPTRAASSIRALAAPSERVASLGARAPSGSPDGRWCGYRWGQKVSSRNSPLVFVHCPLSRSGICQARAAFSSGMSPGHRREWRFKRPQRYRRASARPQYLPKCLPESGGRARRTPDHREECHTCQVKCDTPYGRISTRGKRLPIFSH